MSVICLGVSHHTADLALLERVAVPTDEQAKVLHDLVDLDHVVEAVVLSTCNRVEVYAHVTKFHPGLEELRAWFADRAGIAPSDFDRVHEARYDEQVAGHLFAVASGVRSMVVGERQITLQVKQAAELARAEGTSKRLLQKLFRQTAEVARRVRAETDIDTGVASMVELALDAAHEKATQGRGAVPSRPTVLLVGAGKMGGLAATRVSGLGADVLVWNRSVDKATRLAKRVDGALVRDQHLTDAIAAADIVICTTGASQPVLTIERVAAAMNRRDSDVAGMADAVAPRPLVLCDLSMPRNVERGCETLVGVHVVDIADVRDAAASTTAGAAVAAAQQIVDEEAGRFTSWTRSMAVDPALGALRRRAEEVRTAELERLERKLAGLDPKQRQAVEALTRGIVNTLLHEPSTRLKALAAQGAADTHVAALQELFDLEDDPEGGARA